MCGIAGILARDEATARQALPPLVTALGHRGPDDSGQEYVRLRDAFLGLGHTRLSILDLSVTGHQPMAHPLSGDRLIYNGEIYNFARLKAELERAGARFVGHSDSEVLLHALVTWGPACIPRLQGMFAFAFYDASEQRLILARDSIGIKPLYFAGLAGGGFVFASEVRAILETGLVSRQIDRRGIAGLLAYGAVQGPGTLFRDIEDLPPGHFVTVTMEAGVARRRSERYWTPPPLRADVTLPAAVGEVRAAVNVAVRDHLVSDVPLGVFLSSGIDSTIVAGVASRHVARLRSFTVGFAEAPELSEFTLASETAASLGLDHTRIDVSGKHAETAMVAWLASLDLPSVDGFNVFLISKFVRAAGIKVALSGQGGDELFGGYPTFADVPRLHRWFRTARLLPRSVRRALAKLGTSGRPAAIRAKAIDLADSDGSLLSLYLRRRRAMSAGQLRALGLMPRPLGLTDDYVSPDIIESDLLAHTDPVSAVARLETKFYLGNMLLRDSDVNGMRHGLEIRVPLLDQRLLDLAMPLPQRVRLPSGRADKHLLRQAFPEFLRPALLAQRKRGFVLPVGRWMRGPLRELCEAGLGAAKAIGALDPAGVDGTWRTFLAQSPQGPDWSRAFILVVLGLYLQDLKAVS
jgi:asparagine synthase (glutamine-hydrolysing)